MWGEREEGYRSNDGRLTSLLCRIEDVEEEVSRVGVGRALEAKRGEVLEALGARAVEDRLALVEEENVVEEVEDVGAGLAGVRGRGRESG